MRSWLPLLFAAPLAAAGCAPKEPPLPRDAVPTPRSAAILSSYTRQAPRPEPAPRALPAAAGPEGPDVELPALTRRPWLEPPRTLPYPERPATAAGATGTTRPPPAKDVLRPGDRIAVTVAGHPEFGGVWTVGADGLLDIPDGGAFGVGGFTGEAFAAEVKPVKGFTLPDVARIIRERLGRYTHRQPRVEVKLLRRRKG